MKTLLIIIVAVIVLGGGFYYYKYKTSFETSEITPNQPVGESMEGETKNVPAPGDNVGDLPVESQTNNPPAETPGGVSASVKQFTIEGRKFSFTPSLLTVKKGDRVRITFKNLDGLHDLVIDEFNARTKQMPVGEETIEFVADKAGSFEFYCSVGNHRAMGMKGTIVVQ